MYCEDNFSSDDLFKDFFRLQRNQISDLEETKKLELGSEYEISNLIWNKSDLLDYLDVFVESCSSYLLPKISFSSNSSQLNWDYHKINLTHSQNILSTYPPKWGMEWEKEKVIREIIYSAII